MQERRGQSDRWKMVSPENLLISLVIVISTITWNTWGMWYCKTDDLEGASYQKEGKCYKTYFYKHSL